MLQYSQVQRVSVARLLQTVIGEQEGANSCYSRLLSDAISIVKERLYEQPEKQLLAKHFLLYCQQQLQTLNSEVEYIRKEYEASSIVLDGLLDSEETRLNLTKAIKVFHPDFAFNQVNTFAALKQTLVKLRKQNMLQAIEKIIRAKIEIVNSIPILDEDGNLIYFQLLEPVFNGIVKGINQRRIIAEFIKKELLKKVTSIELNNLTELQERMFKLLLESISVMQRTEIIQQVLIDLQNTKKVVMRALLRYDRRTLVGMALKLDITKEQLSGLPEKLELDDKKLLVTTMIAVVLAKLSADGSINISMMNKSQKWILKLLLDSVDNIQVPTAQTFVKSLDAQNPYQHFDKIELFEENDLLKLAEVLQINMDGLRYRIEDFSLEELFELVQANIKLDLQDETVAIEAQMAQSPQQNLLKLFATIPDIVMLRKATSLTMGSLGEFAGNRSYVGIIGDKIPRKLESKIKASNNELLRLLESFTGVGEALKADQIKTSDSRLAELIDAAKKDDSFGLLVTVLAQDLYSKITNAAAERNKLLAKLIDFDVSYIKKDFMTTTRKKLETPHVSSADTQVVLSRLSQAPEIPMQNAISATVALRLGQIFHIYIADFPKALDKLDDLQLRMLIETNIGAYILSLQQAITIYEQIYLLLKSPKAMVEKEEVSVRFKLPEIDISKFAMIKSQLSAHLNLLQGLFDQVNSEVASKQQEQIQSIK